MAEEASFQDLVRRIRNGEAEAAANLIQRYEADLRLIARARLRTSGLQQALDSVDLCQSVLANF